MSIRYRLKRNSGPVHESIPAHPDAFYRPQYRPTPDNVPPVDSGMIAPRLLANNPIAAAPLAAGGSAFSPWWIIGPLLAVLAAMAIGTLAYGIKKKQDSKKQAEEENSNDDAKRLPVENVPLRTMKPDPQFKEEEKPIPLSSTTKVSGNSPSDTNSFLSNDANKQLFGRSTVPSDHSPLKNIHRQPNYGSDLNTDKSKSKANLDQKGGSHVGKPNDSDMKQIDSPEQHGIGKSPLISSIPTGSKRRGKEKSSSIPNLEQQSSAKDNIHSNKSTKAFSPSDINNKELDDSHSQSQMNSFNPNDNEQSNLANRNKIISLMPNVPQCKTNTSSSDDDYDEIYPLPLNDIHE